METIAPFFYVLCSSGVRCGWYRNSMIIILKGEQAPFAVSVVVYVMKANKHVTGSQTTMWIAIASSVRGVLANPGWGVLANPGWGGFLR